MTLNKTWNNSNYQIPETGEFNWQSLTNFLAALSDYAQATTFQKFAARVSTASSVSVSSANDCIIVSNPTSAGAVAVTLPAGASKQIFFIVDGKGDAATNNITITPDGAETINGAANYVLNVNRGAVGLIYAGTGWSVFAEFANTTGSSSYISRSKIAAGTANHVVINDGSGYLSSEAELSQTRGGTGVNNAGTLTFGSNNITFTTTGATSVTLPTSGTLATLTGTETLENKTLKTPLISNGSIDVNSAGNLSIGASVGANTVTLGGATSSVSIPGNLTVSGTTTTINTQNLDVADKNITTNKGGNDAASEGAGLTIDRTGTKGSLIYKDASASKFAAGALGSEVDLANVSSSQTLTNKTIDAASNTVSNIADANIKVGAAIDAAKIANGSVSNLEFQTLDGVTSAIQTQLDGKSATITGAASTVVTTNLLNTRALISNLSGKIAASTVSQSELETLSGMNTGVGFDVQTQLNSKAVYPTQTGNAGKFLKTDGSATSWASASGGAGEINAILNASGADGSTGWTGTTVVSGSSSPLNPIVATAFSIANSATAETSTSGGYYPFTMPDGLKNKKLKIEFTFTTPATDAYRVSIYSGTTRFTLSTDSGGYTELPKSTTGKFSTTFDTDSSSSWTLSITRVTGSTGACAITNVIVGPGIQPQGAVVGEWQTFSMTITASGANPSKASSPLMDLARYRRVGSFMEIEYDYGHTSSSGAVAGSGTYEFTIPLGLTIDTIKQPVSPGTTFHSIGNGYVYNGFSEYSAITAAWTNKSFVIVIYNSATTTQTVRADVAQLTSNTVRYSVRASVPIAEWAGSGTVNLAQNDVEFASNKSSWDSSDLTTTYYDYGQSGQAMGGALGADRTKRVKLQTPIQVGDVILIECSQNRTQWAPHNQAILGGNSIITGVAKGNSNTLYKSGISWAPVSGSNTEIDVTFYNYQQAISGGTGVDYVQLTSWPSSNAYWRVRKTSAGAAVGFGLANATTSGLISAETLSGEGDLGALSWDGTAPSGTVNKKYRWAKTGRVVDFWFRIDSSVAGSSNSSVNFSIPSDVPAPTLWSSQGNEWGSPGSFVISTDELTGFGSGRIGSTVIAYNTSLYGYTYAGAGAGIAARFASGHIRWFT